MSPGVNYQNLRAWSQQNIRASEALGRAPESGSGPRLKTLGAHVENAAFSKILY